MKFITQLERFERILSLVRRKATGTPEEFANRLGISESTLYEHIKLLKVKHILP